MARELTPAQKAAKNARAAARRYRRAAGLEIPAALAKEIKQAQKADRADAINRVAARLARETLGPALCVTGDGDEVRIGDFVSFKDDIETTGKVAAFKRGFIEILVIDDVTGDARMYSIHPKHAWKE